MKFTTPSSVIAIVLTPLALMNCDVVAAASAMPLALSACTPMVTVCPDGARNVPEQVGGVHGNTCAAPPFTTIEIDVTSGGTNWGLRTAAVLTERAAVAVVVPARFAEATTCGRAIEKLTLVRFAPSDDDVPDPGSTLPVLPPPPPHAAIDIAANSSPRDVSRFISHARDWR